MTEAENGEQVLSAHTGTGPVAQQPGNPLLFARVLSPHHPDVLAAFRRRSPADSAVRHSAPPGSHAAPPARLQRVNPVVRRKASRGLTHVGLRAPATRHPSPIAPMRRHPQEKTALLRETYIFYVI